MMHGNGICGAPESQASEEHTYMDAIFIQNGAHTKVLVTEIRKNPEGARDSRLPR